MRLIVTGATGFVGEALVATAATAGHTGLATGRRAPERLPVGWEGWCRDEVLASDTQRRADAVIHLEAHRPGSGPGAADELVRTNVGGTRAWLEWAARQGIGTFVQASSVLAVSRTPGPIDETAAPQTVEPYGVSKARAEVEVRRWADEWGIRFEYIQPGKPQQNAYVERFNRTVRYEWLSQYHWTDLDEVRLYATQWMWMYNHERPNMALGGITSKQRLAMTA